MPRFPIKQTQIANSIATIAGSDHKHIVRVLRLNHGDRLTLFDESGIEYTGAIERITSRDLTVSILLEKKVETESRLNISLLQGLPKADKMDFIVEKSTELGVKEIIPVITSRSIIRRTDKAPRWRKIAVESAKQCRRSTPPAIGEVVDFNTAIKSYNDGNRLKIIFYENCLDNMKSYINTSSQLPTDIILFIGPEGGFSDNEILSAKQFNFIPLGLGPRILRTETAGIAAISIFQFLYGDI
ncbi:MAG: 16S rRNA (uracil(1498)-N(3))-methyltransferase [Deltaproteobacteria bacterium]